MVEQILHLKGKCKKNPVESLAPQLKSIFSCKTVITKVLGFK